MARCEADRQRREELGNICAHPPPRARIPPPATSREGLTTLWICWVAPHLENSNNALSLGRLDQLLTRSTAGTLTRVR